MLSARCSPRAIPLQRGNELLVACSSYPGGYTRVVGSVRTDDPDAEEAPWSSTQMC